MRPKSRDGLSNAKNIARGAFSRQNGQIQNVKVRGNASPVAHTPTWTARQLRTVQLTEAISRARSDLSTSELRQFDSWLRSVGHIFEDRPVSIGTNLESLAILPENLEPSRLDIEIQTCVERIAEHAFKFEEFSRAAQNIADFVANCKYSEAIAALDDQAHLYGYSFWYLETKLALTRLHAGVDPMKELVTKLSIKAVGHRAFLLHYFGVRNEPSQSTIRFRSQIKKVLDDSKLSLGLQTYLRFRLSGNLEPRQVPMAEILAYEQTTTLIDLLFTLVKICRLIVSRSANFPDTTFTLAEEALAKIRVYAPSLVEPEGLEHSRTQYIATQAIRRLFRNTVEASPLCEDQQSINAIAARLSSRGNQLEIDEASKAFANMSWLPIANAIGEIHNIPTLPDFLSNGIPTGAAPIVVALHSLLSCPIAHTGATQKFVEKITSVVGMRQSGETDQLIEFLEREILENPQDDLKDAFSVVLANALLEDGRANECVTVVAKAGQENERLLPYLPLIQLFVGKRWPKLSGLGTGAELATALSHACKMVADEKLRTFKRYAVEELLSRHYCMTVDELIPALSSTTNHEDLAYFGYVVCDLPTIELLPGMGESRTVRRTRIALLRKLAVLETNRASMFQSEAYSIEEALQVDDGLSVLDDSKVHVDEDAVINFVANEYQADFERYKKLVASGIGTSDSLIDILKSVNNPSARIFQIPKNDADDILVQLCNNILQRFLHDPVTGLDIIIGRRIRHNTISSELRGVLEKDELIGKIHHGRYEPAQSVVRACDNLELKHRKIAFAANARFSEAIDGLVALLRDRYFNVCSRQKPKGVFELTLNPVLITFLRSTAQTCTTLEQFARECIAAFWMFLSFKLEIARPAVEDEIQKYLKHAFQKFLTELSAQSVDLTLISSVQRASEELQRRAVNIASWVAVPKVHIDSKPHPIARTVDIALAVVSGQVPGFTPEVSKIISCEIELDTRGFALVQDALYVVLYNIAQHSGKRAGNSVKICIDFDSEKSLLHFKVINETSSSARKPDKLAKLASIRADIQRKSFLDGARKNKNSGFYKLAAIVYQQSDTSLSFGFIDQKFEVDFNLKYLPL